MANVLVVANRTAECEELQQALKERAERGDDVKFTLVVPSAHGLAKAAGSDAGTASAQGHVDAAVEKLREEGLEVEGQLGAHTTGLPVTHVVGSEVK